MKLVEVISIFESFAPPAYQEKYDNTGLAFGNPQTDINGILLCLDVTSDVVEEAVALEANLVISHHPVIFSPLHNLNEDDPVARIVAKAIRNNIALYSVHTNIDNIYEGVNNKICQKLGLVNLQLLSPQKGKLKKLVVFAPLSHADIIRDAMLSAGAGRIGSYDFCSYNSEGFGTFRASQGSAPFVGEIGKLHTEKEIRIETIIPDNLIRKVISAMLKVHPYEEAAFDIYPLDNEFPLAGSGMTGETKSPLISSDFLSLVKKTFNCGIIRHTKLNDRQIRKVAVCGGAGSFLIDDAIRANADIMITADIKYHDFFRANERIILADIGHYESEQFTIELFYDILKKNFHTFAIHFSKIKGNPINYF